MDHHSSFDQVASLRAFNRFYTRRMGLLDEGLLHSEFSLTESRVLYELAHRESITASDLTRDLGLDAGYLSRILNRFEKRGLLAKSPSISDARQSMLALTPAGHEAFAPLDSASRREIGAMLDALKLDDRDKVLAATDTISRIFGGKPEPRVPYIIRPLRVGDIGWITHRQGLLYAQEYGWDETYEALVAEILAAYVKSFDRKWECAWIAEREGEVVGSVFLVKKSDEVARLRLLYVEPSARGLGIGRRLVSECIAFARTKGYAALTLWTNDVLVAARRIYEAAGFRIVEEERHHSFGKDLVGQTWNLDL